jgi:hypothetical protein
LPVNRAICRPLLRITIAKLLFLKIANRKPKMKFDKYFPVDSLKPYIKYFVVSENELENEYKVFPTSGLVIGFQYKGQLSTIQDKTLSKLAPAGLTGISSRHRYYSDLLH